MRPVALLASILALAACQPETAEAPAVSEAEAMGQDEAGAPEAPRGVEMAPVTFQALSKTAEAFTGAISLTAITPSGPNDTPSMILEADSGLRYKTDLIPGGAEEATAIDWSMVFGAPIDLSPGAGAMSPSVDVHIVTSETIPKSAVNGSLCDGGLTFALAMAVPVEVAGTRMMSIAAFRGLQWPPKNETDLCGVFNYALP